MFQLIPLSLVGLRRDRHPSYILQLSVVQQAGAQVGANVASASAEHLLRWWPPKLTLCWCTCHHHSPLSHSSQYRRMLPPASAICGQAGKHENVQPTASIAASNSTCTWRATYAEQLPIRARRL
jgi:hypothetical protein